VWKERRVVTAGRTHSKQLLACWINNICLSLQDKKEFKELRNVQRQIVMGEADVKMEDLLASYVQSALKKNTEVGAVGYGSG
jgi:hypothetical protein